MEQGEQQFVKGFNSGYLLARHEPDLLHITKTLQPNDDYLSGLFSGKEEFELEKAKERLDDLAGLRGRSNERNFDERAL